MIFINYLFRNFGLRKLYFEALEFNLKQFGSGIDRYFVEEGRLVGHEYYDGRYWDMITLALYRDVALDACERLLRSRG